MGKPSFTEAFAARLSETDRARFVEKGPRLETLLETHWNTARTAWPGTALERDAFLAWVAERLPAGAGVGALEGLRASDLYLACACAGGDPAALAGFERVFGPEMDSAIRRLKIPPDLADEVRSRLLRKLLVMDGDRAPVISRYGGTGDLRGWVKVVATREGIGLLREQRNDEEPDDERLAAPLESDPELQYLKESYRAAFKESFLEAIATLPVEARGLLKLHHLDGLSSRQIAKLRDVHHATVARQVSDAREEVLSRTRKALMMRLKIDRDEFESVMRLIQTRWAVTVRRFLGPDDDDDTTRKL